MSSVRGPRIPKSFAIELRRLLSLLSKSAIRTSPPLWHLAIPRLLFYSRLSFLVSSVLFCSVNPSFTTTTIKKSNPRKQEFSLPITRCQSLITQIPTTPPGNRNGIRHLAFLRAELRVGLTFDHQHQDDYKVQRLAWSAVTDL